MTNNHGIVNEEIIEDLCHRLFGCDFVLRSPQIIKGSSSRELTDFLILIDDTVIVIQSKSLAIDISDLDAVKFRRIQRRQEEAKRQLNATFNAHERGAIVRATSPLGLTFNVDWSFINHKIGIVTLTIPDTQYLNPEFRFQYPLVEKHKGITIHTFIASDILQMTTEFDIPGDILRYMEIREKCFFSGKLLIGNELDFLAMFKTRHPELERLIQTDEISMLVISPGCWESYKKDAEEAIEARNQRFKKSQVIDNLIRFLRTSVVYTSTQSGITEQQSAVQYMKLIGKLGRLSRIERTDIAEKILLKVEKTKTEEFGYFLHSSITAKTAYLFLFINEPDREFRKDMLYFLCEQACHLNQLNKCNEVFGVVTSGAQQQDRAVDAILINMKEIRSTTKPDPNHLFFKPPVYTKTDEWGNQD
jgi:hypothetical protein